MDIVSLWVSHIEVQVSLHVDVISLHVDVVQVSLHVDEVQASLHLAVLQVPRSQDTGRHTQTNQEH